MEIRVSFPGGKRVDAELEGTGFVVRTDQARDSGGDGAAPEPYQLFLASIATCAGIYVLSFCQERGLPADAVTLVQRHDYDDSGKKLTKVKITLDVAAEFPEKYRRALVRAVNLCAVKRALADPPQFEVEVRHA
ncbi:MAG: OsmC family protein [Verrucomicrobia bacterium]|nr:OsmC family protein [Verrucomicrobiota bacterium]